MYFIIFLKNSFSQIIIIIIYDSNKGIKRARSGTPTIVFVFEAGYASEGN